MIKPNKIMNQQTNYLFSANNILLYKYCIKKSLVYLTQIEFLYNFRWGYNEVKKSSYNRIPMYTCRCIKWL